MQTKMQNPGGMAGASQGEIGSIKHQFLTASDRQTQMLAARFYLSPWMARDLSRLCFGEGCNE